MNITETNSKQRCYALVTRQGNLIVTDYKLPIYWRLSVAKKDAEKFKAEIVRIKLSDLAKVLN